VIAEEGDYVEEVVECRAEVPSDPGPFSEDVPWTISCLGLRVVPLCSLLSLTGDEVSLYFLFLIQRCKICY